MHPAPPTGIAPLQHRLAQAKWALMRADPFLGYLASELPSHVVSDPEHPVRTAATDMRAYYYNEAFCQRLDDKELMFVVIHEALHVLLAHGARRGTRQWHLFNVAADHAINLLIEENFGVYAQKRPPIAAVPIDRHGTPPGPIVWMDPKFRNKTAEEIYEVLLQECVELQIEISDLENHPGDLKHRIFDPQTTDNESDPQAGREALARAMARSVATRRGSSPSDLERMAMERFAPEVRWEKVLRSRLTSFGVDNANWSRPHKKYLGIPVAGHPLYLPSRTGTEFGHVAAVVDTSGSINDDQLSKFLAEINHLLNRGRVTVHLFACDSAVHSMGRFNSSRKLWESVLKLPGGGGTDFRPAFAEADKLHRRHPLTAMIYFTDADGIFPERAPAYPCLWILLGRARKPVPFGESIRL